LARTNHDPSSELSRSDKARISRLRGSLLGWFEQNGRTFPWRSPCANTYEKICVEVLLQRTRAETVAGIYREFFSNYPGWAELSAAPISELEEALKPVGLWRRRAASMHALATRAAELGGEFPREKAELSQVPAVGQYVANAILLFQHGLASPLVDVNMARLLERYLRPRKLADIRYDPWLQAAAQWLVGHRDPVRVNWATLDFAAVVCRARAPLCKTCFLRGHCNFARKLQVLEVASPPVN
jgi:A/G-specific adenine glycosylase